MQVGVTAGTMTARGDGAVRTLIVMTSPEHTPGPDILQADALFPHVYEELRRLARARLRELRPGQTLQTTALVHEAYLRLVGRGDPGWSGRAHFFGAVARAMRLVLVDYARHRGRVKRGGGWSRTDFNDGEVALVGEGAVQPGTDEFVEVLGAAIARLEPVDRRKADIASLFLLVGMTHEQIAESLEVSVRTVEREWRFTRAWLQRELEALRKD